MFRIFREICDFRKNVSRFVFVDLHIMFTEKHKTNIKAKSEHKRLLKGGKLFNITQKCKQNSQRNP